MVGTGFLELSKKNPEISETRRKEDRALSLSRSLAPPASMNSPSTAPAMHDDMGCMSMVMTFSDFSQYKLKILFDNWDVQTKWQFLLSFIAVIIAGIGYHYLRYSVAILEQRLRDAVSASIESTIYDPVHTNGEGLLISGITKGSINSYSGKKRPIPITKNIRGLCLYRSVLSTLMYALALMLMLVAMTYNSWLFLSLTLGYFIGDYLFFYETFGCNYVANQVDTACH